MRALIMVVWEAEANLGEWVASQATQPGVTLFRMKDMTMHGIPYMHQVCVSAAS
jgi:hypothetical protein